MQYLYINGKYRSTALDNISTMVQAFNYGTAAFEGMKAFYNPATRKSYVFRPDQHFQRLTKSAEMIDIELKLTLDQFVGAIATLIRKNKIADDTYIRPIVYRDFKGVGLSKPSGYGVSIFTQPSPHSSGNRLRACFVSQRRPVDGTFSVKLTGNYLLSYFAYREANRKGYDVGILQSSDGYLSEATVMNLFLVRKGQLLTPSTDCGALSGITRLSVMQVAKGHLGLRVSEGKYRKESLLDADEAFLTGTGSGVNFIAQIEKKKLGGSGKNGVSAQVAATYEDLVRGRLSEYSDWLVPLK